MKDWHAQDVFQIAEFLDDNRAPGYARIVRQMLADHEAAVATADQAAQRGRADAAAAIRALDPVEAALAGQHAWNDAAKVAEGVDR